MTDAHNDHETSPPAETDAAAQGDTGTLVAWTAGSGDSQKSHVVHIGPAGMTWALNLKKSEDFGKLVGAATAQPAEAAALIQQQGGGRHLPADQIARVTYTEGLNQLLIFDTSGRKQKVANGKDGEQEKIFEAVGRYLGGTAGNEDADAWSVMQVPLFSLAVFGAIGGFFIYSASMADPNYQATGRRRGIKQLLNWIGYTVGPTWMSVIVGALLLLIFSFMVFQLVKRPQRQILDFQSPT